MEIDDFKSELNQRLETPVSGGYSYSVSGHGQRTRSVLHRLLRNLYLEILLYLLSAAFFLWQAFTHADKAIRMYYGSFVIILPFIIPIYFALVKRIKIQLASAQQVAAHIRSLHSILNMYKKRYFVFNMVMFPVCVLYMVGLFLWFQDPSARANPDGFPTSLKTDPLFTMTVLIVIFLLMEFVLYWFTRLYLHLLYGRYLHQLKKAINDMEEDDQA